MSEREELAAELGSGSEDEVWAECLRSDDPYCWADPDAVAEWVVASDWLRAHDDRIRAETWADGHNAAIVNNLALRAAARTPHNPQDFCECDLPDGYSGGHDCAALLPVSDAGETGEGTP